MGWVAGMLGQARIGKPYWALISTSSSLGVGRVAGVRGWEVEGY